MTEITVTSNVTTETIGTPTPGPDEEIIIADSNDEQRQGDRNRIELHDTSIDSLLDEDDGGMKVERKQSDNIPNFDGNERNDEVISSINVVHSAEPKHATPSISTLTASPARVVGKGVAQGITEPIDNERTFDQNEEQNSVQESTLIAVEEIEKESHVTNTTEQTINENLDGWRDVPDNDVLVPTIGGSVTMVYHNNRNADADNGTTNQTNTDLALWKVAAITDVTNHKAQSAAVDPPAREPSGRRVESSSSVGPRSNRSNNGATISNGTRLLQMKIAAMSRNELTAEACGNSTSLKHQSQQHERVLTKDMEVGSNQVNIAGAPGDLEVPGATESSSERPIRHIFRRIIHYAVSTGLLRTTTTTSTVVTKTTVRNDHSDPSLKADKIGTSSDLQAQQKGARKPPRDEFDILNLEEDDDENASSTHDDTTGTYLDQSNLRYANDEESSYNIAVAEPVKCNDASYFPAAIEYDTDHKYNPRNTEQKRRRRRFLQFGVVVVFLSIIIGTSVGISRHRSDATGNTIINNNSTATYFVEREKLGIYEMIIQNIPGTEGILQTDGQHPYTKAYRWIMYNDPLRTVPLEYPQFLQRYVLATLYYSTSQQAPWSQCAPPQSSLSPAEPSNPDGTDTDIDSDISSADGDCVLSKMFASGKSSNHWLTAMDECLWAGVFCDEGQNIQRINIADLGLSGTIPETLFYIPMINVIELSSVTGNLTGTIPGFISKCLISFRAKNNLLTGSVPLSLLRGRSLLSLLLGGNLLTGNLDGMKHITRDLRILDLAKNNFDKSSLTFITRLHSLSAMFLDGNQFTGTIPSELLAFPYLSTIDISDNLLTGTIPELSTSVSRFGLHLSKNQLTGSIPHSVYNQTSLISLELNNNDLNGTISSDIQYLSNIDTLLLNNNERLEGTIPSSLGMLTSLRKVIMQDTSLTGQIPAEVCNLRTLALSTMTADCSDTSGSSTPEIICPDNCCTVCCDRDGDNCMKI